MNEKGFENKDLHNPLTKDGLIDVPVKRFSVDNPDQEQGEPRMIKQFKNDPERIVKISRKENIYRFSPVIIKQFENDPERKENTYRFSSDEIASVESAQTIEIQDEAKKHFEELEDKYGISVAPFEYKIDLDEEGNENVLYCISDKIHGDNLITKLKEKYFNNRIGDVEKLLISLTGYFKDKYKQGNYYLGDLANLGNYMYGRRKDEKEDKLYLIDTEPVLVGLKTPQEKEFFNERVLKHLLAQIEYIEKETGKELVDAHKEYDDLVKDTLKNKED